MAHKKWLYHQDCVEGKLFDVEHVERNAETLKEQGWLDTPATLKKPEVAPEITEEKFKKMAPQHMIEHVKSLGFLVMTPDQFKAEIVKALHADNQETPAPPAPESPEDDEDEFETESVENDANAIIAQFEKDPEVLTKDELVEFGNAVYGLSLTKSSTKAELIAAITEAQ